MLEEGISYPLKGERALGRIVIGGLLGVFAFLIVPGIALFGYLLRALEASARDADAEPPAFEDWGGLIVDGIRGLVVAVVYGIVPFVLLAFALGTIGAGLAAGRGAARGLLGGLGALGVLLSLLVMFVLYYTLPAALANMTIEDRIGAAFDFGRLKQVLLSVDYLIAWVLPFVIAFVANLAMVAFGILTLGLGFLVLAIVGPFIQFYVQLVVFYLFGRAYGSVVDVGGADAGETAPA